MHLSGEKRDRMSTHAINRPQRSICNIIHMDTANRMLLTLLLPTIRKERSKTQEGGKKNINIACIIIPTNTTPFSRLPSSLVALHPLRWPIDCAATRYPLPRLQHIPNTACVSTPYCFPKMGSCFDSDYEQRCELRPFAETQCNHSEDRKTGPCGKGFG